MTLLYDNGLRTLQRFQTVCCRYRLNHGRVYKASTNVNSHSDPALASKLLILIMRALTPITNSIPLPSQPTPIPDWDLLPFYNLRENRENISPDIWEEIESAGEALLDSAVWSNEDDSLSIAMPEEEEEEDEHQPDYPLPADLADVSPYWWDEHPAPHEVVFPPAAPTAPTSPPATAFPPPTASPPSPIEITIYPVSPSERMVTSPP